MEWHWCHHEESGYIWTFSISTMLYWLKGLQGAIPLLTNYPSKPNWEISFNKFSLSEFSFSNVNFSLANLALVNLALVNVALANLDLAFIYFLHL